MTVAIIGDTLILLAPLLLCTRRLIEARQRGLLEYGDFAASYTQAFDDKWLRGGKPDDSLLGSADVQSLADLSNSFDVIGSMRIVPLRPNQLLVLVVAGILPTLPLALFVLPLDELILRGVQAMLPL